MTKKTSKLTKNAHGVTIKKCCASCKYKKIHPITGTRRCVLMNGKKVDKADDCKKWEIISWLNTIVFKRLDKG